jgi:MFS family permease
MAGGSLIVGGRRPVLIIANLLAIIFSITSIIPNLYIIGLSRTFYGFTAGVIVSATPKMIEETVPNRLMDRGFGISTNAFINSAILLLMILGNLMP